MNLEKTRKETGRVLKRARGRGKRLGSQRWERGWMGLAAGQGLGGVASQGWSRDWAGLRMWGLFVSPILWT